MFGPTSLLLALLSASSTQPPPEPERGQGSRQDELREPEVTRALKLVDVQDVWAEAPHSAFTDLAVHGDALVLAFREGRGHVSADGSLRVLRSLDGRAWTSAARLSMEGYDLRDADLSVAPDGRLLLIGGAAPRPADGERAPTGTIASLSSDGIHWSAPRLIVDPGRWLWRVTWLGERAFGVSYSAGSGSARLDLLTSPDGESWTTLAEDLHPDVPSNETVLAFFADPEGGEPLCAALARAEGRAHASIGIAAPPYERFDWTIVDRHVGGPNLTRSPRGSWIAAGRVFVDGDAKTGVFFLDPATGSTSQLLVLPSGGDTSYPGLAWWQDELYLSYYSSHPRERAGDQPEPDVRSRILVARVRVED